MEVGGRKRSKVDIISELPEPILHHILSFLLFKDAAQTSTLSTTWSNVWSSLPYLNFGNNPFVVFQALAIREKQRIPVQKFSIKLNRRDVHMVHTWIHKLVVCNIKELDLKVSRRGNYFDQTQYSRLPEAIFNAKSLEVLKLDGFRLELPSTGTVKLPSLREFRLCNAFLEEGFIQSVCANCCNIEILYLSGLAITQELLDKIFSCLQNLQELDLTCGMPETMKISSIHLKRLRVRDTCNRMTAAAAELDTPNLVKFSYASNLMPILKLKASSSLKAKLSFDSEWPYRYSYPHLTECLSNFSCSMAIELTFKNDKALALPDYIREHPQIQALELPYCTRETFLPPLSETSFVRINIQKLSSCSIVDVLDDMFWISPQLDTLSFLQPDLKTLKFIYRDATDHNVKPCCTSQPWKCWRHKLRQVEMQNFTCMEERRELRNYFLWDTDVSKIVELPE